MSSISNSYRKLIPFMMSVKSGLTCWEIFPCLTGNSVSVHVSIDTPILQNEKSERTKKNCVKSNDKIKSKK